MRDDVNAPDHFLLRTIGHLAHLLPAGPISIFIHHNTLHAFEHLSFEDAVEHAAMRLEREPYLAESRYRDKLASGRIRPSDVEALLVEQLGASAAAHVADTGTRLDFWRAVVLHGIPAAAGRELSWLLEETDTLVRFRADLPASARSAAHAVLETNDRGGDERQAVRRLWNACLEAVRRAGAPPVAAPETPVRHRDWLLAVHRIDTDAWIHPPLIRFLAGYLDQGLRTGPCPGATSGFTAAFSNSIARPGPRTAAAGRERFLLLSPTTTPRNGTRSTRSHILPRSSVSLRMSARTISAMNCWRSAAGPASSGKSKNGPTACLHVTSP
jgi:hypothetical protein